jgi:hypothetical protein
MKTKIVIPIFAPMFNSATPVIVLRKMMNMTVAITEAAVTMSALRKARMATGSASQRVKMEMGIKKMRTKVRHVPVRKRPNIHRETYWIRVRISLISAGRLTAQCC